jgi:GxxExxY protein
LDYSDVTEKIIGCAYQVYNKMGFGFLESVYEKCMIIELMNKGLQAKEQEPITVYYNDKVVGNFIADIIVNDVVIVELKSIKQLHKAHEIQLVNYLVATQKPIGLLLNFGESKLEVRRKIKELPG